MKHKSILDPSFKWVRSDKTDIRKTFARVRKEMEQKTNVTPIRKEKRA